MVRKWLGINAIAMITLTACGPSISSFVDKGPEVGRSYLEVPSGIRGAYYLARTILNVTVSVTPPADSTKGNSQLTFTITKTVEADPDAKLFYVFEPSAFSDDNLDVTTGESGLLASVSANTTDRSGDIAVKVAQLLFTTATGGAPAPASGPFMRLLVPGGLPNTNFAASYDPFNREEAIKVRNTLLAIGQPGVPGTAAAGSNPATPGIPMVPDYCILVGDEVKYSFDDACIKDFMTRSPPPFPIVDYVDRYPGIYYRRPVPLPVRIFTRTVTYAADGKTKIRGAWTRLWMGSDLFFDKTDIYQVRIDRTAFIARQTSIKFTNGTLTEVNLVKPSEALAAANYPVTIARLITSIPLAGLQQDVSVTKAQADLIAAQTNLINLQKASLAGNVVTLQPAP